ncbi:hypothetical protein BDF20DRAFT_914669 [Mycotypha africana]|uniref:uncharacterized protein n=1 Tax=Mycotypha africana TaxID=64632 RepID=UPI0023005605|nr:uncharacterized protein BDF20DRAFT_914669 [Mycotypha africana]KAI8973185.1 hypothetical protein BDF20DRAFT_914669 [Mycotypha africana]
MELMADVQCKSTFKVENGKSPLMRSKPRTTKKKHKKESAQPHDSTLDRLELEYTLKESINYKLVDNHERYTLSIPLEMFRRNIEYLGDILEKITEKSSFLRESFWYTVCRFVYGAVNINEIEDRYPALVNFGQVYNQLGLHSHVTLTVEQPAIRYYGQVRCYSQVIFSACETLATSYENYYVENFEDLIAKYLLFFIKATFPSIKMTPMKDLVMIVYWTIYSLNADWERFEIRNRLPRIPVPKATLIDASQIIIPLFRQLLQNYRAFETAQADAQAELVDRIVVPHDGEISAEDIAVLHDDLETVRHQQRSTPRKFSMFPNSSLEWRSIIDPEDIFPFFGA